MVSLLCRAYLDRSNPRTVALRAQANWRIPYKINPIAGHANIRSCGSLVGVSPAAPTNMAMVIVANSDVILKRDKSFLSTATILFQLVASVVTAFL